MRQALDQHYPLYDIDIQGVLVQWDPIDDTLVFDLKLLKVFDLDGDEIAYFPQLQVGVKTSSILDDEPVLRYINIVNSRITLFRTAGGAIKFDIGHTDSGASGKILENLLIGLAAAFRTVGDVNSFPKVSIIGGKLFLGDEITGIRVRIPKVDLWLEPDRQGVASGIELDIAAPNGNFQLQADILYRTSDQGSMVDISLDKFRPSVLSEILPGFKYLEPIEVMLSGHISGELNKFFELKAVSFDLKGRGGSLEIFDFIGYNMSLKSMNLLGTYEGQSNSIKLDSLRLTMENGVIDSTGVFAWKNEKLNILSQILVSGDSTFSVPPQLYSQLPPEIVAAFDYGSSRHSKTVVTAEGIYDQVTGKVVGQGVISRSSELDTTTGERIAEMNLAYKVDGPLLRIPNITLEHQ